MAKNIIDKILWIEGFYPFSLKYDLEKTIDAHRIEFEPLKVDPTTFSIFKYSHYFNSYFKEICNALEKALEKSTLNKAEFINLIIGDLNRTDILITEDTNKQLHSGDSYDSNVPANIYIQKSEFQNSTEPVWGLIDSAIETATLNLNYLNYVKFNNNYVTTDEIAQVDVIKYLTLIGSTFNAIKQSYDKIIWRGEEIKFDYPQIKLVSNQRNLMLDNVALTRLTRNISNTMIELQSDLEQYKEIRKIYHLTRSFQIIKSIEENEELKIRYQPKSKNPTNSYISFLAPILTYYPFYHSEKISKFEDLTIIDLVNLFSSLYDFVAVLPMPPYDDTGIKDLTKFKRFNPWIKKSLLLGYFKNTVKYKESQILIFLNLLTKKGNKHDLFLYPIYEEGEFYFFSHATILRANMLYLVDKWLEAGNCDLAKRGFKFEDYIKDYLRAEKLNEFAKFDIVEQSKFSFIDENSVRQEEEIDLVLKTESTIIVAEIKCITYPFEQHDFYTSFQTIKKAKNQVLRKSAFLENNWERFENVLGKKGERKIVNIIVVNFPQFAGRIIDNVPVSDFLLFLSYFVTGKLTNIKMEVNKEPVIKENHYYTSSKTFEDNFESFFKDPIPMQDLISRQKIEEYEVTLEGTDPKTIAERVIYIEKTLGND